MTGDARTVDRTSRGFSASLDVAAKSFGGSLVILQLSSARFFELGPTGAVVWSEMIAGQSIAATASYLAKHFGMEADAIEEDLLDFVTALIGAGLLIRGADGVSSAVTGSERSSMEAGSRVIVQSGYSKPTLLCRGHIREFTDEPLRCDQ